jgi:hypothetical protein
VLSPTRHHGASTPLAAKEDAFRAIGMVSGLTAASVLCHMPGVVADLLMGSV